MASCRGLTEIVVLVVGLEAALLSVPVFTALVLMSLVATVSTGPALRKLVGSESTPRRDARRRRAP